MTDRVSIILTAVARECGLAPKEITTKTHQRRIAWPRQIALALSREITGRSLPDLGQRFGMHHTTVLWAETQCRERIEKDAEFRELFNACRARAERFLSGEECMVLARSLEDEIAQMEAALDAMKTQRRELAARAVLIRAGGPKATASGRAAA